MLKRASIRQRGVIFTFLTIFIGICLILIRIPQLYSEEVQPERERSRFYMGISFSYPWHGAQATIDIGGNELYWYELFEQRGLDTPEQYHSRFKLGYKLKERIYINIESDFISQELLGQGWFIFPYTYTIASVDLTTFFGTMTIYPFKRLLFLRVGTGYSMITIVGMDIPPMFPEDDVFPESFDDEGPAVFAGFGCDVPLCSRFSLRAYIDYSWYFYRNSDILDDFSFFSIYFGIDWHLLKRRS